MKDFNSGPEFVYTMSTVAIQYPRVSNPVTHPDGVDVLGEPSASPSQPANRRGRHR